MMPDFNPDDVALRNGKFGGLPLTAETAKVVVIPVPWDVTVSSRDGTAKAPGAILDESCQLDFFDRRLGKEAWRLAPFFSPAPIDADHNLRLMAAQYISWLEEGGQEDEELLDIRNRVNLRCEEMVRSLELASRFWLDKGKIVGVVGGDHSTPLGLLRAIASTHARFQILHLDAHMDLREAYEGFEYSHASIMRNAMKLDQIERLVQVGVRDFCASEWEFAEKSERRVRAISSEEIHAGLLCGSSWDFQTSRIIRNLVEGLPVYVSFDIDVFEPWLCPHTGTPVPGGLLYEQVLYLLRAVSRRFEIIGFDLTEIGNNPWDASVGARVLYNLSLLAASSAGIKP